MPRLADRVISRATRVLHRIHPVVPETKRWPGMSRWRSGLYQHLVQPAHTAMLWRWALLHRARLEDTVFIGVTGSAGKTMTKRLVTGVLSMGLRGGSTLGSWNSVRAAAASLIRHARRDDQFHVVELSAGRPGVMGRELRLVRPRIGIVTNVGTDHYSAHGSIEALAAEKERLVRALPSDGVAVLNADDPRVRGMQARCACRVITFGVAADAMVQARNVSATWPAPLEFDVSYEGRVVRVSTRLFGTAWVGAALAAIATGIVMGVPLEAAAEAIGRIEPAEGRMQPVFLPNGITFIRDDWKASVSTIPPALAFLKAARATRKIAVLGTISDTFGDAGRIYGRVARHALEAADLVCFVGPQAFHALRSKPLDQPDRMYAFGTAGAAQRFLSALLEPGDLVLLKGSNNADHICRLAMARMAPVACWRMDCKRQCFCDACELVGVSSGAAYAREDAQPSPIDRADEARKTPRAGTAAMPQILVGLGNAGQDYRDTPHNVGHAVLDRLAADLNAAWHDEQGTAIARTEWHGRPVWLIKPDGWINHSGRVLEDLARRTGFLPGDCVLVYDDFALPLGVVRTRMRGSDGGHRGVRSILEAFQTDRFRRVKIGVRRPDDVGVAGDAVLKAFGHEHRAVIDAMVAEAQSHLRELVTPHPKEAGPTLGRA